MSQIITELQALHAIDLELVKLKKVVDAGPEEARIQEAKIVEVGKEKSAITEKIRQLAINVDKNNLEIKSLEADLDDMQEKVHAIKNSKEYKIVTERIKDLKQSISSKEDEELGEMEELDTLRQALKDKQDESAAEETKLEEVKGEIDKERGTIKVRQQELAGKRKVQIERVRSANPAAMETYREALQCGKGDALAEIRGGICQKCHRKQSPNVFDLALGGKTIKGCVCADCGRILYAATAQEQQK